jgi:hypothetical protein
MAGVIFMSSASTREQCFQAGVFGLPIEYESFVYNIRKGMPLFLFAIICVSFMESLRLPPVEGSTL